MQPLLEKRAYLENESKENHKTVEAFLRKIKTLKEEERRKSHKFDRDIKKIQKKQEHIKKKNEDIEKRKLFHFESLGKKMNEIRVKDKNISTFYPQIDKIDKTIEELKAQIQSLYK
jgi:chromosome segregation ATPase